MSTRTKLLIALGVVLVVVAAAWYALRTATPSGTTYSPSSPPPVSLLSLTPPEPSSVPVVTTKNLPTISADLSRTAEDEISHVLRTEPVRKPATLDFTYTLKTTLPKPNVTSAEVTEFREIDQAYALALAERFGFVEPSLFPRGDYYDIAELGESAGDYSLQVHRRSGYAHFRRLVPAPGKTAVSSPAQAVRVAQAFLAKVELGQPGLGPAQTYERNDEPGTIFVEYHRAWDPLPIYQPLGLVSSTVRELGVSVEKDPTIWRTSDGHDGFARAADFNTVTVAVDASGSVNEVQARMRPVLRTLDARPLRSAEECWADLQAGKGVLGLALPSFGDLTSKTWDELFPGGIASSEKAVVEEAVLAAIELPGTQRQRFLQPAYIFRGTATLASGITTDFVVAVPALADDSLPSA